MTHEWTDPDLPLTDEQRAIPISGVLPSGEAGMQNPVGHDKINKTFPYPNQSTPEGKKFVGYDPVTRTYESGLYNDDSFSNDWWSASGSVVKTYGEDPDALADAEVQSGIFSADGLSSPFSNNTKTRVIQIEDFASFNPYIHFLGMPDDVSDKHQEPLKIDYPYSPNDFGSPVSYDPYGSTPVTCNFNYSACELIRNGSTSWDLGSHIHWSSPGIITFGDKDGSAGVFKHTTDGVFPLGVSGKPLSSPDGIEYLCRVSISKTVTTRSGKSGGTGPFARVTIGGYLPRVTSGVNSLNVGENKFRFMSSTTGVIGVATTASLDEIFIMTDISLKDQRCLDKLGLEE